MRKADIDIAMPILQLNSLILTIGFKPDCEKADNLYASEVPDPISITVSEFDLDKFIEEATYTLGMDVQEVYSYDEWEEDYPVISKYIDWHEKFCPYIINSAYVDEMMKFKVAMLNDLNTDESINWEVMKR